MRFRRSCRPNERVWHARAHRTAPVTHATPGSARPGSSAQAGRLEGSAKAMGKLAARPRGSGGVYVKV